MPGCARRPSPHWPTSCETASGSRSGPTSDTYESPDARPDQIAADHDDRQQRAESGLAAAQHQEPGTTCCRSQSRPLCGHSPGGSSLQCTVTEAAIHAGRSFFNGPRFQCRTLLPLESVKDTSTSSQQLPVDPWCSFQFQPSDHCAVSTRLGSRLRPPVGSPTGDGLLTDGSDHVTRNILPVLAPEGFVVEEVDA